MIGRRHQQDDPAPSSDAADSNDLNGGVDHAIGFKEDAAVFSQIFPIGDEHLSKHPPEGRPLQVGMKNRGWNVANAELTADHPCELGVIHFGSGPR